MESNYPLPTNATFNTWSTNEQFTLLLEVYAKITAELKALFSTFPDPHQEYVEKQEKDAEGYPRLMFINRIVCIQVYQGYGEVYISIARSDRYNASMSQKDSFSIARCLIQNTSSEVTGVDIEGNVLLAEYRSPFFEILASMNEVELALPPEGRPLSPRITHNDDDKPY